MKRIFVILPLLVSDAAHAQVSTLSIAVSPPALALILNPSGAVVACDVAGGTLVSQASTTGGDGNTVTFSMTGNTIDFDINPSTGAITVAVGGITLADCGKSYTNTVRATQP